MGSLGVVAAQSRGWRPFAIPAAFLLAVTIAVAVVRSLHGSPTPPVPTQSHLYQGRTPKPPTPLVYRVHTGDTLAAIAARRGMSLARIQALNPTASPTALFIGEKIRLR
jgi:LysM repeat protein